jgi:dihydrofolate reductase
MFAANALRGWAPQIRVGDVVRWPYLAAPTAPIDERDIAAVAGYPPEHRDFARVWQKAEQIVFSRTLTRAPTRIARVEREFDPEATRKLKRESAHDIFIGGAELTALALESDLVDECHLFLHPVIVGGGKPAFRTAIRQNLELLDTRRFGTGAIHLRYRLRGAIRKA